jgi:ribonuclease VapC
MERRGVTEALMVETSALVAIILEEPGWRQVAERIVGASAFTTCFNVFEAALALVRERRLTPAAEHLIVLDATARLDVEIRDTVSRSIPHAIAGRERFCPAGRGLNMGDCPSHGAAKESPARLIYVGEDLARTDVNDEV